MSLFGMVFHSFVMLVFLLIDMAFWDETKTGNEDETVEKLILSL